MCHFSFSLASNVPLQIIGSMWWCQCSGLWLLQYVCILVGRQLFYFLFPRWHMLKIFFYLFTIYITSDTCQGQWHTVYVLIVKFLGIFWQCFFNYYVICKYPANIVFDFVIYHIILLKSCSTKWEFSALMEFILHIISFMDHVFLLWM